MEKRLKAPTSFRLSPRALQMLQEAAEMDRRSKAQVLELAIEKYHAHLVAEQGERKAAA